MTSALDTELELEGIARELVNKINTMRREADYAVSDRIHIELGASDKVKQALMIHGDYLQEEVLATQLTYGSHAQSTHWDINGEPTAIYIVKA